MQARVARVVYGASEPKFGAVTSLVDLSQLSLPHRLSVVSGVLEHECRKILKDFFASRRENV